MVEDSKNANNCEISLCPGPADGGAPNTGEDTCSVLECLESALWWKEVSAHKSVLVKLLRGAPGVRTVGCMERAGPRPFVALILCFQWRRAPGPSLLTW